MSEPESPPVSTDIFAEPAYLLRNKLRQLAIEVNELHSHPHFSEPEHYKSQHDEMHANIMLAYRHLEDATMRIGKAVQAYDGGISVYPR